MVELSKPIIVSELRMLRNFRHRNHTRSGDKYGQHYLDYDHHNLISN
jgi:hypothetical protein